MLDDDYQLDSQGMYKAPAQGADFNDYTGYIDQMPAAVRSPPSQISLLTLLFVLPTSPQHYYHTTANLSRTRSASACVQDDIEVFGLHSNVNITAAIKETNEFLGTMLSIQPRTSGGGGGLSREEVVDTLAKDILVSETLHDFQQ